MFGHVLVPTILLYHYLADYYITILNCTALDYNKISLSHNAEGRVVDPLAWHRLAQLLEDDLRGVNGGAKGG